MEENANKITATVNTYGNQEMPLSKALEVRMAPCSKLTGFPAVICPVMINAKAVIVQTTTVSIKGSSRATKPSLAA